MLTLFGRQQRGAGASDRRLRRSIKIRRPLIGRLLPSNSCKFERRDGSVKHEAVDGNIKNRFGVTAFIADARGQLSQWSLASTRYIEQRASDQKPAF